MFSIRNKGNEMAIVAECVVEPFVLGKLTDTCLKRSYLCKFDCSELKVVEADTSKPQITAIFASCTKVNLKGI